MSEEIGKEFEQQDIDSVKNLQSNYASTTAQIGQVEVELHLLTKKLEELNSFRKSLFQQYEDLQTQERELVNTLNEKYGDGVLDLDSGRFIPSNV
jgi:DNA-binding PucR family transcriptional regulator